MKMVSGGAAIVGGAGFERDAKGLGVSEVRLRLRAQLPVLYAVPRDGPPNGGHGTRLRDVSWARFHRGVLARLVEAMPGLPRRGHEDPVMSDGPRNLFPAADRKTVAAPGIEKPSVTGIAVAEACANTGGRPRKDAERRFRELLRDGLAVNAAKEQAKCSDAQALRVLTELFDVLRDAA